MFGRLWGKLLNYIESRNAQQINIKEKSEIGLNTEIIRLMREILKDKNFQPENEPAITDAALLMAADGYGTATVEGIQDGEITTIKTSDTQLSFLFDKDPSPQLLAEEAEKWLARTSSERDMEHK
ncbi:hypothetical protein DWG20_05165 [Crenobacter cavernae]|uniref:Uncharacterized protein n=1 Tax=Crenobacter cavernae TaxID=2290923 RepID=A0A345Y4L8_9NEIS|nr:hypothetical protein DWG20_05165 [Crenobacter cavernae]